MRMVLFIRASELIAIQLKVYMFGEDGMPHKLHIISVDDVTSSNISVQRQCYKVHNIVSHHGPNALCLLYRLMMMMTIMHVQ